MGMFDDKLYLTGDNGIFEVGQPFILHDATTMGRPVTIQGRERSEVKLEVARMEAKGEVFSVFTSGAAIVNQVERMSAEDKSRFPMTVVVVEKPSGKGNPMNLIMPYEGRDDDIPF